MIMQAVIKYMLTKRGLLRSSHRKNIGSRINDYAGCGQIPLNVLSLLSIETETHMIMQAVVTPVEVLSRN